MTSGKSSYLILVAVTLVVVVLLLVSLARRADRPDSAEGFDEMGEVAVPGDARKVVLPVKGMTCLSCEMTVERALTEIGGVYRAKASAEGRTAVVYYDPERVSPSNMREAIEKVGYLAEEPDKNEGNH